LDAEFFACMERFDLAGAAISDSVAGVMAIAGIAPLT